ncbi:cytochrome P450 [Frankia sp. CNm7]|uniref:Cytochrome P450 n=1 Tax=Frankia nepalensis TaxID=1836974 RepID=A0A937UR51_9ACTN|nr:cytochrome P450 [Frankia nepalensis]MBL7501702.1 cytochrome P450 [Frankia nepalensis]MBL7513461.1 cytochrome P450 [Frankia nepalensis]MBL7521097.1 cytochrome P450 [Frankia nepalensis]MBL7632504.1 cytochrome P450 [Frankia nepalensis]
MTTVPDEETLAGADAPDRPGPTVSDLGSFNPFGEHSRAAYEYFELARRERPVFYSEALGAWCVTRFADIRAMTLDPATYSSAEVFRKPTGLPEIAQRVCDFYADNGTVTTLDPPAHGPIRRGLHESFSPRAIAGYEPTVRTIIGRRVDAIDAAGGRFDLVSQFSTVFPLAVVLGVIGLPEEDLGTVRRWAEGIVTLYLGHGFMTAEEQEALGADLWNAVQYYLDLVERRAADPGEDLVSYMIHNEVGGRLLTPGQIANNVFNLVAAGNETTGSALTNIMVALLSEPGRWAALARGELDLPTVIAEGLRLDAPVVGLFRTATREVALGDVTIGAGDKVLLLYGSGNHDETVADEPGRFRLDRRGRVSLTFGHGMHNCVGAPLARLELRTALELLANRFPDLRLASGGPLEYKPLAQVRTPAELWLTTGA